MCYVIVTPTISLNAYNSSTSLPLLTSSEKKTATGHTSPLDHHLSPPAKPTVTPTAASSTAEWLISKRRGQHDPTEKVNNRSVLLHPFLFFVPRVLLCLVVQFPGGSDVEGLILPHDHVLGENHCGDVGAWHLKHGLQQKRFLHKPVAPVQSHILFLPVTEATTAGAQHHPPPPPISKLVHTEPTDVFVYEHMFSISSWDEPYVLHNGTEWMYIRRSQDKGNTHSKRCWHLLALTHLKPMVSLHWPSQSALLCTRPV